MTSSDIHLLKGRRFEVRAETLTVIGLGVKKDEIDFWPIKVFLPDDFFPVEAISLAMGERESLR
jgi:hypothetical protein